MDKLRKLIATWKTPSFRIMSMDKKSTIDLSEYQLRMLMLYVATKKVDAESFFVEMESGWMHMNEDGSLDHHPWDRENQEANISACTDIKFALLRHKNRNNG